MGTLSRVLLRRRQREIRTEHHATSVEEGDPESQEKSFSPEPPGAWPAGEPDVDSCFRSRGGESCWFTWQVRSARDGCTGR